MTTGHCFCGHVSYRYEGERTWSCYCHCSDCRRNCAAPLVAFIGVSLEGFSWRVGGQEKTPKFYASSPGVKRYFCDECGTPMAFQADHYLGEIHLYAPTLANPDEFQPEFHVHYQEKLSWLHLDDGLYRYDASAPANAEARDLHD